MDFATLLIDVVIGLWIIALIVGVVRALQSRTPRMKALSPEAQQRYLLAWDVIETGFMHTPEEAVRKADALLVSLMDARRLPLLRSHMPRGMRRAREIATRGGRSQTENLRQAMLLYRKVFDQMVGQGRREQMRVSRRELA